MRAYRFEGIDPAEDPDLDLRGTGDRDTSEPRDGAWATWALTALLVGTIVLRLIRLDQPIVENYVGRQVPTAMVARNLERGSGFFHPQLDTAPFPNYFPVEPPAYQLLSVALRRVLGCSLQAAGRLASAIATTLGAWGLFGLVRRRESVRVALVSTIAFSLLPVAIRYGRAFQPDALMLGGVLAGLNCWDLRNSDRGRCWLIPGWIFLALGFACKVTAAVALVPLGLVILRPPRIRKVLLAVSTLLPVLAWYAWAGHLVASGGSRAAEGNRDIWLTVVGVSAIASRQTLAHLWRFFIVRAFTPPGLILASWGLASKDPGLGCADLWRAWGLSVLASLAILAGKLHHEYYWLGLAPVVAVGIGRGMTLLARRHRGLAWGAAVVLLASSLVLTRSTWQTPLEWQGLVTAGRLVRERVPSGDLVVASEPLLFAADRRGCRLEFTGPAASRAESEWREGGSTHVTDPLGLIEFYRLNGARYVADVAPGRGDGRRIALHEAIRRRYKVQWDDATVIIAELVPSETPGMSSEDRPVTIPDFATWKTQGRKIAVLTAYDYPTARLLDSAGVDCLLVGDSMGTAVHGRDTTLRVTLDQVIYHAEMVARASRLALVVADLPFLSYHESRRQAIHSSGRVLKETNAQAVKLEGGRRMAATIRSIVECEIPVMGHVGLTPQSIRRLGSYKVQRAEDVLRADAQAVAEAGAFAVVLECVPAQFAARITAELPIPTIGIGAGAGCDGQVLVLHDMLGLLEGFRPRFARRYAELGEAIKGAATNYVRDVKGGQFPAQNESFR